MNTVRLTQALLLTLIAYINISPLSCNDAIEQVELACVKTTSSYELD